MKDGYKRYCDKCGVLLGRNNNKCGFEICDKCNEEIEKLTKECEEAYNKGYADGVKSVNICPHCGEYIGEEE